MNRKVLPVLVFALVMLVNMACGMSAPAAVPAAVTPVVMVVTATADAQATINAAVAATAQQQNNLQATTGAGVVATIGAMPPTSTPAPAVDANNLSEEELEAMINQAVNEAVEATTQASASATQAASDQAVTTDEYQTVYYYSYNADQAIAYAEQLVNAYSQVYGDLATEAMESVNVLSQELSQMAGSIDDLNSTLEVINTTLESGQQLATETIQQLQNAASAASQAMVNATNHAAAFTHAVDQSRDNRVRDLSNIQPDNIPTDLQSTLSGAFSFLDTVRGALGDNKLDRNELTQIAQFGANLGAGFQKFGAGKFDGLSGKLSEITGNLARGRNPDARRGLGDFEKGLGQRPANLPKPGGLPGIGGGRPKGRP